MLLKYKNILICLSAVLVCVADAFAGYGRNGDPCDYSQMCAIRLFCDLNCQLNPESNGCCQLCTNAPFSSESEGFQQYVSYGTDRYGAMNDNCSWYMYKDQDTQWNLSTNEFTPCDTNTQTSPAGFIIYYNGDNDGIESDYLPYGGETGAAIKTNLRGKDAGTYFIQQKEGQIIPTPITPVPGCTAKPYPVSVNCAGGRTSNHTYCNTDLYRQYDNKVDWFYDYDDVSVGNKITTNLEIPTKNCAVFNGFYDTNNTMVFSATGVSQTTADNPIITGPGTTITAQWTPAQYTLQINNINNATSNCTCGQNCAIPAYTNCTPGKYVSAITVLDDCGTIADGVFTPSATCQIQNGTQITLNATLTDCEKGYYCVNGVRTKCTNGRTSETGAKSEDDCIYGAGTTYTDTHGGSFKLPVKINVVLQQN